MDEQKILSDYSSDSDADNLRIYGGGEEEDDDDDDQIKEPEGRNNFNKEIIQDAEQGTATQVEPDKTDLFGDEEAETSDSGLAGSEISEIESLSDISQTIQPVGRGRGRFGKVALDHLDRPLPPPGIIPIERSTISLPKATLPAQYYIRREGPEEQEKRRAARRQITPLVDFQAKFNHIAFIVDKDDSKEKGYQHACRRFQVLQPDLPLNTTKPYHDIWNFGLYIYSMAFEKSISCNLLDLFPQEINDEENRPFWFMFKRPPVFSNLKLPLPTNSDSRKGISVLIDRAIGADLSSGALISMSRYCVHPDHIHRKRNRWSFYIHEEYFEIHAIGSVKTNDNPNPPLRQVKYKIPLDIIDRAVVFYLWRDGFCLFINMKGNIHQLHRERKMKSDEPFERQGKDKHGARPLFSTVRIRICMKSDEELLNLLDREGITLNITSKDEINRHVQKTRDESLEKIRGLFKHLLDFFYKNRIHVCFGSVGQRNVSIEQLSTLDNQRFPTFIQSYSWAMLRSIGFRTQVQLVLSQKSIDQLHDYSQSAYSDMSSEDINDRFYRLCLYLHRRSSEYFFFDLYEEIQIGIEDYQMKCKRGKLNHFNQSTSTTAYIPSVVLTPTTIKIRPLKLCKLNRVLRATRRFGGVLNFALIELRDEAQRLLFPTEFRALKDQILDYLTNGFDLASRQYKYLHHSQSQVKCKQFWFYYHDEDNGRVSHDDAYSWMGNFDKERVVAKHAARIALCFTSTEATVRIPSNKVTYIRDIKDATKKYAFTDGVGTISSQIRDQIKKSLKQHYEFSVIQIRYGGCKGTVSVDPRLDNQRYQMYIRDSMNKFTSDHDLLEVCKLSAPRALYLNRQDIVLLEARAIPHTNFLHLQNKDHFWLIRALLTPSIAYELLDDKLLRIFQLDRIARGLNIVEEQFFVKLIITCASNIIREIVDRTRIQVSKKKARNMFGIVDECGVLEYGQVFVQYSSMRDNKLERSKERRSGKCQVLLGKVVVTKNPCHHPGDLRIFEAVDRKELQHLKDVIVFPQKGHRPHSNEISGSDLDGDEYVVIWHEDLIPSTPNETPYDYDSQEEPPKMNRSITRQDINQVVMEVSEQDCLGSLSNIHLAFVDKFGIQSKLCTDLAGHISQEVDAAKTGKHPLSELQISDLRKKLDGEWPDFMRGRGKKDFYPSKRVLGKLYRSARRALTGWSRAISNHGNPRYIDQARALTTVTNHKDQEPDELSLKSNVSLYSKQPLDPYIDHPDWQNHLREIKSLYHIYVTELLEIINLYRFQDEIDLLCRGESMDASPGGRNQSSLEDSAAIEIENLTKRIIQDFYNEIDERREWYKCCGVNQVSEVSGVIEVSEVREVSGARGAIGLSEVSEASGASEVIVNYPTDQKRMICERCSEDKLAKAACAYKYSYEQSNRLPLKSNRRILSFPWLFAGLLLRLRDRNKPRNIEDETDTIVGRAFSVYLKDFTPKFKVLIPTNSIGNQMVEFYYEKNDAKKISSFIIDKRADEKLPSVSLLRACFIEVLNDWLTKENVFGRECIEIDPKPLVPESLWHELMIQFLSRTYRPNVRLLSASKYQTDLSKRYGRSIEEYRQRWTNEEYRELQKMFDEIHAMAAEHAKTTRETQWSYLDEYIILALQCISIEKRLVENWICP